MRSTWRRCARADPLCQYQALTRLRSHRQVRDLLAKKATSKSSDLKIRENKLLGPYLEGANVELVETTEQMHKLLEEGNERRKVSVTNMNEASSRSHAIITIKIQHVVIHPTADGTSPSNPTPFASP